MGYLDGVELHLGTFGENVYIGKTKTDKRGISMFSGIKKDVTQFFIHVMIQYLTDNGKCKGRVIGLSGGNEITKYMKIRCVEITEEEVEELKKSKELEY